MKKKLMIVASAMVFLTTHADLGVKYYETTMAGYNMKDDNLVDWRITPAEYLEEVSTGRIQMDISALAFALTNGAHLVDRAIISTIRKDIAGEMYALQKRVDTFKQSGDRYYLPNLVPGVIALGISAVALTFAAHYYAKDLSKIATDKVTTELATAPVNKSFTNAAFAGMTALVFGAMFTRAGFGNTYVAGLEKRITQLSFILNIIDQN